MNRFARRAAAPRRAQLHRRELQPQTRHGLRGKGGDSRSPIGRITRGTSHGEIDDIELRRSRYGHANDEIEEMQGDTVWIGGLPRDITEREIKRVFSKIGDILDVSIKRAKKDTFCFVSYGSYAQAREAIREFDQANLFSSNTLKVSLSGRNYNGEPNGAGKTRDGCEDCKGKQHEDYDYHEDSGGHNQPLNPLTRSAEGRRGFRGKGCNSRDSDGGSAGRECSRSEGDIDDIELRRSRHGHTKDEIEEMQGDTVWIGGLPRDITEREINKVFSKVGAILDVSIKRTRRDTFCFISYGGCAQAREAIREFDQANLFGSSTLKVSLSARNRGGAKDKHREDCDDLEDHRAALAQNRSKRKRGASRGLEGVSRRHIYDDNYDAAESADESSDGGNIYLAATADVP